MLGIFRISLCELVDTERYESTVQATMQCSLHISSMEEVTGTVALSDEVIKSFAAVKVYPNSTPYSSIDYHSAGQFLVTANSGALTVYDIADGEQNKKVLSQKFGTDIVRYTHHPASIVYTGTTPSDCALRYLSLHDNKIVSVDMCPVGDQVLTASADNSVRLWDLNNTHNVAIMQLEPAMSRPCVAFDPAGMIFAMALAPFVRLYNLKQLAAGPFAEFSLEEILHTRLDRRTSRVPVVFCSCKLDAMGQHILVTTNAGVMLMIDSFHGRLEQIFVGYKFVAGSPAPEASFSADGQFVFSGSDDGSIFCWNTSTGQLIHTWQNAHPGPVKCLKFNPLMANFASASSDLNMWLPNYQSLAHNHQE